MTTTADRAIAWLSTLQSGAEVSAAAIASALGVSVHNVGTALKGPLATGAVERVRRGVYRLTVEAQDDTPRVPLLCGLWSDGDLSLRINGEDIVLPKVDADVLRAYLAQFPPPPPPHPAEARST